MNQRCCCSQNANPTHAISLQPQTNRPIQDQNIQVLSNHFLLSFLAGPCFKTISLGVVCVSMLKIEGRYRNNVKNHEIVGKIF